MNEWKRKNDDKKEGVNKDLKIRREGMNKGEEWKNKCKKEDDNKEDGTWKKRK